jgi:hypothetical protein
MVRRGRAGIRQAVASGIAELVPDPDRGDAWTLMLDGTPQSYVDLADPAYLDFEYVRRIGHVIDAMAPPTHPLRVLHLGAGALTLARYVAATRPRSRQRVVEVDGALVEFVRRELPLGDGARPRITIGDARDFVEHAAPASFDLVIADAFAGGRAPAHLTSAEFVSAAAVTLRPGGVYAANIADGKPLAFARSMAATLRSVFGSVCLIAEAGVLRGRRFGNLVLTGGRETGADLSRAAATDPFPGRVMTGTELDNWIAGAPVITDADAGPSPIPPPELFTR